MINSVARMDTQQRRLLITGAGGFVGAYLIKEEIARHGGNSKIFACTLGAEEAGPSDDQLSWHNLDILDQPRLRQLVDEVRPTHVVHLAAISDIPTAAKNPGIVWDVNVIGTLNLFEVLRCVVPEAVILFVSSSEIYGRSFQSGKALDESAELQPRNPYATSKAAGDLLAGQYAETSLKTIRARPFNHIGAGQSDNFVVSAFALQIAKIEKGMQEPKISVGNLDAYRDFLDVRDVVCAYLDLIDRASGIDSGSAFNVCSGKSRPIKQVLEDLVSLSKTDFEIVIDPERLRLSDTPLAAGDASKVRSLTGWKPKHEWSKTLEEVLDHWRVTLS